MCFKNNNCRIWNSNACSLQIYGSVQTKKSMNGVHKTNIDRSFMMFIQEMVENYCTLGKIQTWLSNGLGPTDNGE